MVVIAERWHAATLTYEPPSRDPVSVTSPSMLISLSTMSIPFGWSKSADAILAKLDRVTVPSV
jgi:hypothetical protein